MWKRKGSDYLAGRKRDFNRIFKTIPRWKVETIVKRRYTRWTKKNGILFFPLLLSFANRSLDRCVRFRSGSRIFPVLSNPRRRRCAFTKVEPVGTIRRKKPKDRDARKESKRREEREEGREEGGEKRRGEERRDEKRKNVEKSDGLPAQNVVQRHCRWPWYGWALVRSNLVDT